jgi:purine-binding chemotaxis protein CheW
MSDTARNKSESAQDEVLQWVTFHLNGETYGVNVMAVKEVLRHIDIAPVPGSPDYVLGIINIRGTVISVINTRRRFGLPDQEPTDHTRIVIIEIGKYVVGIMADSVAEVVYLRQSEIETTPNVGKDNSARFIQGVCNKNDELLILVEFDKLISQEELEELSQD